MKETIRGKAYVLGDNIDTDQIIPARYLVYNPSIPEERKMFGMYALSAVPTAQAGLPQGSVPFVKENEYQSEFAVIIGGKNFGCGSSREHAPLAIREAGVEIVIAEFYARIFFRNAVNGGYLVPFESQERLCETICTGDELRIETAQSLLHNVTTGSTWKLKPLGEVAPIIEAGGVFPYARKVGMLPS
jgi:3-isopropylmalate/(R)-2-methylmalate dehydratase small subunit